MAEPVFVKCEPAWSSDTEEPSNFENSQLVSEMIPLKQETKSELTEPGSTQQNAFEGQMDLEVKVKEEPICSEETPSTSCPSADIKEERLIEELVLDIKNENKSRPDLSHVDLPPSLGPACFNCDMCGKVLANKKSTLQHLKGHTGNLPFKCDHCHKNLEHCSKLLEHVRTRTGEKRYRCTVCGKSYSRRRELSIHNRKHTGLRPYECSVCNKTFADSRSLATHKRIHTGEKPYHCTICNMQFTVRGYLSKHLKSHRGERLFRCSVCNKAFSQKGHLPKHLRLHTGERPYKCNECGKSFITSGHLTRHMRVHTGERPYKCAICSKMYKRKIGLSRHILESDRTAVRSAARCSPSRVHIPNSSRLIYPRASQECSVSQYGIRVSDRRSPRVLFESAHIRQDGRDRFISGTTFPARKHLQKQCCRY